MEENVTNYKFNLQTKGTKATRTKILALIAQTHHKVRLNFIPNLAMDKLRF